MIYRIIRTKDDRRKNVSIDLDLYNKLKPIKEEIRNMGVLISYSGILRFIFNHVNFEKIEELLYEDCRCFLGE